MESKKYIKIFSDGKILAPEKEALQMGQIGSYITLECDPIVQHEHFS